MVVVPDETPVTSPVASTDATAGLDDIHAPPVSDGVSCVVSPTPTAELPETVDVGSMVIGVDVREQPLSSV